VTDRPDKNVRNRLSFRKLLVRILGRLAPSVATGMRQSNWDRVWSVERGRPDSELSNVLPLEIVQAVDSQWIQPGAKILDIGSGRGQISAWLAERGFHVLAADFSKDATSLGRKHFGHIDTLEFKTVDMCADSLGEFQFDVLIDKGCFHHIPDSLQPRYVINLSTCTKSGARFMLFHRSDPMSPEAVIKKIKQRFDPHFEIDECESTIEPIIRSAGPYPRRSAPGLVFKLIRK